MTDRTRRYAKRPKVFAAVFVVVAVVSTLAVAGLTERAAGPGLAVPFHHRF